MCIAVKCNGFSSSSFLPWGDLVHVITSVAHVFAHLYGVKAIHITFDKVTDNDRFC